MHNYSISNKSKKLTLIALLFAGWFCDYLDRMVMSLGVTGIAKDFHLAPSEVGIVLSSFFVGYAFMQIPGGWLADKFGSKKLIVISIVMWSLFTVLTGLAWSLVSLLIIRFLFGIGQGSYPASAAKSIAENIPHKERGKAQGIAMSANPIGLAIAPLVSASIMATFGWRPLFIVMGVIGIILTTLFIYFHPSSKVRNKGNKVTNDEVGPSVKDVLCNIDIWKLAILDFGLSCASWGFSSWLPSYLMNVRHVDLVQTGIYASLPFVAAALTQMVSGWWLDKFLAGHEKIAMVAAGVLSVIFFYLMFNTDSLQLSILYQILASIPLYFNLTLIWVFVVKIFPTKTVGTASGIMNFGGNLAGVFSPMIMGFLISASGGSYISAFWFLIIAMIISIIATLALNKSSISNKGINGIEEA
ncbi:sugar phosphate permease [Scopulibacillus darangshiensis]|uniref:Sugar phosphate permease n=1 Tax=Scopulibacillus darangshiensis TaxID=442528 RepID=A0A4R2PAQ5_9BACL|nr:MFS transporter [Scopulibacillus darangshiensis]TCP30975.1 sugar phosphate permease [Scopulibacillus darangshiensis]